MERTQGPNRLPTALHLVAALITCVCLSSGAVAAVYKCVSKSGSTAFQDYPCPNDVGPEERAKKQQREIDAKCQLHPANPSIYYRCVAEIRCDNSQTFGSAKSECIQAATREMQWLSSAESRATLNSSKQSATGGSYAERNANAPKARQLSEQEELERGMRRAKALANKPLDDDGTRRSYSSGTGTKTEEPVDCISLSLYAKAQGHGIFERAMIVEDAERRRACKRNPP